MKPASIRFVPLATTAGPGLPAALGALAWKLGADHALTVVAKISFAITTAGLEPCAPEPIAPTAVTGEGAVLAPADLVPKRAAVDVIATGRAQSATAPEVDVRFGVRQGPARALVLDVARRVRAGRPAGFEAVGATSVGDVVGGVGGTLAIAQLAPQTTFDVFQCAPANQRLARLDPAATLLLQGVHPRVATLEVTLPNVRARAVVFGADPYRPALGAALELVPDTVLVNADAMRVTVVFRGAIAIPSFAVLPALTVAAGASSQGRELLAPTRLSELEAPKAPAGSAEALVKTAVLGGDPSAPDDFQAALAIAKGRVAALAAEKAPLPKGGTFVLDEGAPAPKPPASKPGDRTELPGGSQGPVSLPFGKRAKSASGSALSAWARDVSGSAEPESPHERTFDAPPAKQRSGDTVSIAGPDGGDTMPFANEAELEATRAKAKALLDAEAAAKREAEAAKERARLEREAAERAREEAQKRFEHEQARLREVEANRKREAAERARREAAAIDEALYGSFTPARPKKK